MLANGGHAVTLPVWCSRNRWFEPCQLSTVQLTVDRLCKAGWLRQVRQPSSSRIAGKVFVEVNATIRLHEPLFCVWLQRLPASRKGGLRRMSQHALPPRPVVGQGSGALQPPESAAAPDYMNLMAQVPPPPPSSGAKPCNYPAAIEASRPEVAAAIIQRL